MWGGAGVCWLSLSLSFSRQEHGELQLRSDLLDCHVDVCSPEVLVQLSDNFDYQVGLVRRCNAVQCGMPFASCLFVTEARGLAVALVWQRINPLSRIVPTGDLPPYRADRWERGEGLVCGAGP